MANLARLAGCFAVLAVAACAEEPSGRSAPSDDRRACLTALDAGTPAGEPCDWAGSCSDERILCEPGQVWGPTDYDCVDGQIVVVRTRCTFDGGGD